VALGVLVFAPSLSIAAQNTVVPSHVLRLGDRGEDVRSLQKFLNAFADTEVAKDGIGSAGYESDYFGAKTLDAVKRFQNKHAADILSPLGLSTATGIVGRATLQKMQKLSTERSVGPQTGTPAAASSPAPSSVGSYIPLTRDMQIPAGVNPNSINLEYFVSSVDTEGKKQGLSEETLRTIESVIRATAATTTDFRKEFFASASLKEKTAAAAPQRLTGFAGAVERLLMAVGFVRVAQAFTGIPFGGALLYVYPCSCPPGIWLIGIQPLPPSFAPLLSYQTGAQLFASYNIPATTELLGFYAPGIQACWQYAVAGCYPLPNAGLIEPIVGSAPL